MFKSYTLIKTGCVWHSVMVFVLSLNGRYQRKACVPQVLPQTRQNYYRNLQDIETCLQGGNNGKNSNIWFSTFKIWVTSVTNAEHSECPSMSRTEENMSQIKEHVFGNICVTNWNLENGWESWVGSCLSNLTQDVRIQWTDKQKQNHVKVYGL